VEVFRIYLCFMLFGACFLFDFNDCFYCQFLNVGCRYFADVVSAFYFSFAMRFEHCIRVENFIVPFCQPLHCSKSTMHISLHKRTKYLVMVTVSVWDAPYRLTEAELHSPCDCVFRQKLLVSNVSFKQLSWSLNHEHFMTFWRPIGHYNNWQPQRETEHKDSG